MSLLFGIILDSTEVNEKNLFFFPLFMSAILNAQELSKISDFLVNHGSIPKKNFCDVCLVLSAVAFNFNSINHHLQKISTKKKP